MHSLTIFCFSGYVRLNPAKSKHLETATTIIYGYPVDLVNLRTESYGKGSRIPSTVVRAYLPISYSYFLIVLVQGLGSPEQDSRRRDFTINALYYNIRQDRIEDYTGQVCKIALFLMLPQLNPQ